MVVKTIQKIISNSTKIFKGLCTPAQIETVLSIIGISSLITSCLTNSPGNKLQVACTDAIPYAIVSILFIFIHNALCKGGATIISWIIVLAPLVSILLLIFLKPSENSKEFYEDEDYELFKEIEDGDSDDDSDEDDDSE